MKLLNKFWFRLFLIIALSLTAIFFLYGYNQVEKPFLVNMQGRSFEHAVVTHIMQDNLQEDGSRIGDQVVQLTLNSGPHKGENVIANAPNGMLFGTVVSPDMKVVVISSRVGTLDVNTIYSPDRNLPIYLFVGFFLLMLSIIGGKKGIKSAIALVFTFLCFIYLFFPMILRGLSPILSAIITSVIVLIVTIFLINGCSVKSLAAICATFGGIITAGITAIAFSQATSLSGYNVSNIESLLFIGQSTLIDVGEILFAGILFASLGAVMDIAMDISSAVSELRAHNPNMSERKLFKSGMNVGRDVMGTMSTTLILAFFGGSLGIWVLDYVYDLPYLQLINSNSIGLEIMKGISGSFGVIFTVPLASFFSAWLPKYITRHLK